jgi:hypothetical protein
MLDEHAPPADTHRMTDAVSSIQQATVRSQIDVAVAKKAMDAQRATGDAAIALLQSAADVAKQTNAQGAARGAVGGVDTYA